MTEPAAWSMTIRTPEGVEFAIPLAGPIRRFLALLIDLAAIAVLSSMTVMLLNLFGILVGSLATALSMLTAFVIAFGYHIALEWLWRGRTVGKFVLGIRVMDAQGLRLQFSQVALRNLLRLVDMLPAFYLAGGAAVLLNARGQRLGDLAANTIVARRVPVAEPDFEAILPDKYNSFRAYPHLEARLRQRVSPEEAALLLEALLRRERLEPGARLELYGELAAHFGALADFPESATLGLSDEQFLRNVAESLYRHGPGRNRT